MARNYFSLFFKRISKDLRQRELLPIKFVFFMQTSTILVLYPYLTIHMRELGIDVEETAIMSAVTPVIGILMPPIAGLIADKIGNFRILLSLFSFLGGASALLLLLVPVGRVTVTYPDDVILGVSCTPGKPLSLSLYEDIPCTAAYPNKTTANLQIKSCGVVCNAAHSPYEEAFLKTNTYGIGFHDPPSSRSEVYTYTVNPDDSYETRIVSVTRDHQYLKNNELYSTAIRKLSNSAFFFPASDLFNFSCGDKSEEFGCLYGSKNRLQELGDIRNQLMVDIKLDGTSEEDASEKRLRYSVPFLHDSKGKKKTNTCFEGLDLLNHISVTIPVALNDSDTVNNVELSSCGIRCIATSERKNFCNNTKKLIEYDVQMTFWSYLGIRVFIGIIGGTAYTMFEGAVIACLREYKADYGLQRVYAAIGGMISSPLSGWMIDYFSEGKGYTDFRPVFYLYAILKSISAVLMLFINLEFKSPAASVVRDVLSLMNIELISLFVACFLLGSAWGYIESFLFWLIQDLGGSKSLMGLTITVGGILGIPLLVISGPMIKKIGHANIIFIGFIAYALRLMGYSVIYNPWHSLFFEAMECFTHSLCFTAAITYAARLSTRTTDTTIQGIFGGLFYGVGRSFGSLVGGYLIKFYGIRGTFQIFSFATGIVGIVYLAFYHLYMRKRSALNKEVSEKPKDTEKPPQGFEDIDLNKKEAKPEDKPMPLPYEEAVTNLGYEETELEEEDEKPTDVITDQKQPEKKTHQNNQTT